MTYVALWARAFAITLAVEVPIATWLLRDADPSRLRRAGAALAGNLATHPAVWFILPALALGHAQMTAVQEGWAVLVENGCLPPGLPFPCPGRGRSACRPSRTAPPSPPG